MNSLASWHAAGLRWIGSLFTGAADYLEQRSHQLESGRPQRRADDLIDDLRFRLQNRI